MIIVCPLQSTWRVSARLTGLILKSMDTRLYSVVKQLFSCDCGNVMECIVEYDAVNQNTGAFQAEFD